MKQVEYIIVGNGYAAIFFAHQLIRNCKSFLLFSDKKRGASHISAGIINPVVLKRFTTFWLANEQISALEETLSQIEEYTGENYLISEPILRIFHDETEKKLWLKKSSDEDLCTFFSKNFITLEKLNNPFDCGLVKQSARLNVTAFFEDFFAYLEKKGQLLHQKFDYQKLLPSENRYDDINYQKIVFAEGMEVQNNPFFSEIPVLHNKGHHLEVQLSVPIEANYTIKKKHFLFPKSENTYYYGGTYDREESEDVVDENQVKDLSESLAEFYPHDFEIKSVEFGFRPTVKDRRPILGNHQEFTNLFVFNGLGARGVLNGNYFAKELFDHINLGKPIHPEVDWKRFTKE